MQSVLGQKDSHLCVWNDLSEFRSAPQTDVDKHTGCTTMQKKKITSIQRVHVRDRTRSCDDVDPVVRTSHNVWDPGGG